MYNQRYDYGGYYASKTYNDPIAGGQVLFGWVLEERNVDAHGDPYGWAGVQSLPRLVTIMPDGVTLNTYPVGNVS